MTHFDTSEWADFARGLLTDEETAPMSRHLDSGCQRCAQRLALQRTVVALADADRRLAAPDFAVRQIKGFFALNRPERRSRLAPIQLSLLWDSGLEPVRVGVRGGDSSERQVLFESEHYGLDLRIVPFDGRDAVVTGLLARRSGAPMGQVPTYLVVGDRVIDQATSDEAGQFELEADLDGPAELWLEVAKGQRIAVAVEPVN